MEEKKEAREERNREKLANEDWVMAEFYASWCPHCKRMQPIVEEFKKAMEGTLEVVKWISTRKVPLLISTPLKCIPHLY